MYNVNINRNGKRSRAVCTNLTAAVKKMNSVMYALPQDWHKIADRRNAIASRIVDGVQEIVTVEIVNA